MACLPPLTQAMTDGNFLRQVAKWFTDAAAGNEVYAQRCCDIANRLDKIDGTPPIQWLGDVITNGPTKEG